MSLTKCATASVSVVSLSSLVGQEIQFINIQINTYKCRLCVYGA